MSESTPVPRDRLMADLLWLAIPIVAENVLHMLVGLNDVYLASHLLTGAAAATAAIGSIAYVLWLVGLAAGAVGTGSTAIIARSKGARHQRLANSVCGQSITAAMAAGVGMAAVMLVAARPLADCTGLQGDAYTYALFYMRVLGLSLPFSMVMFAANACLRGAGDSVTPAIAMIVVDVVNMLCSFSLTRGWWGLPAMGFRGIALGTVIAYVTGGLIQWTVLVSGRGALRLYLHRLRPRWLTLKRILRIGIPSGMEGLLTWVAQFAILIVINRIDPTNLFSAAHIVTIRIESISFMAGLAVSMAAATMVGQSLGMKDPARARRSANLAFALGGGIMTACGVLFLLFGNVLTRALSGDPRVAALAATCLRITAFSQIAFAASMIYGGALRGAGDTFVCMVINLASIIGLRLTAVLVVALWFHRGLAAIWIVLAAELTLRGVLIYARFRQGGWRYIRV